MNRIIPLVITALALLSACTPHEQVYRLQLLPGGELTYDDRTPCTLIAGADTLACSAHLRGGYSRRFSKHSYSLKFGSPYSLCGLPADKDWVLNASAVDRTFMRHRLSFDIFRSMHPDNRAPLCAYAITADGLYVVMQHPDASTLGIDKADPAAVVFKEPPLMYPDSTPDLSQFQKYPKPRKAIRTDNYLALRSLIHHADDSTFAALAPQLLDLRSVADLHLLVLLTNNADGLLKGFYLYQVDTQTPWRMAPWDYDHSFGRDGDAEPNMLLRPVRDTASTLLRRLMHTDYYPTLLANRWTQLRQEDIISERTLLRRVGRLERLLRRATAEDLRRWPTDETGYMPDPDFGAEVDTIRRFIPLSIGRLDARFGYAD